MEDNLYALFTSRVRLKILKLMLLDSTQMYYVREITRIVEEEVNAVRRELERLKKIGLLSTEQRRNRLYYKVREEFVFFPELLGMVGKIVGLGQKILEHQTALGAIKFAALARGFVQGKKRAAREVDLIIVGKVNLPELQSMVRSSEQELNHEINYTVLTEDELDFRKKRNDAFIRDVLLQPLIVLIGDEAQLRQMF